MDETNYETKTQENDNEQRESHQQFKNDNFNNLAKLRAIIKEQKGLNLKNQMKGYGLSLVQSSSTYQKSIIVHSIQKNQRFQQIDKITAAPYYLLPSTQEKRAAGFGFGNKEILSLDKRKNAELIPAPNKYIDTEYKINKNIGKSFGISYEFYKKDQMPNINPGPGEYDIKKPFGFDKPQIKIKGQKTFQIINLVTPSPCHYQVNNSLTLQSRHKDISMRKLINYSYLDQKTPGKLYFIEGPGQYENLDTQKSFIIFQKKKEMLPKFSKEQRFFDKLIVVK